MTIQEAVEAFWRSTLVRWEGSKLSLRPQDRGNWTRDGRLVGSKWGVTSRVYAAYKGIPEEQITREIMNGVTLDEATDIAVTRYYEAPRFDRLAWNHFTSHYCDWAYNSGARTSIRYLQRLVGAGVDGLIGPDTIHHTGRYLFRVGHDEALRKSVAQRKAFFTRLVEQRPDNALFLNGWHNRANSFLPENVAQHAPLPADETEGVGNAYPLTTSDPVWTTDAPVYYQPKTQAEDLNTRFMRALHRRRHHIGR